MSIVLMKQPTPKTKVTWLLEPILLLAVKLLVVQQMEKIARKMVIVSQADAAQTSVLLKQNQVLAL